MLLKRYHRLGPVSPWRLALDQIDCVLGMHCLPEGQEVRGKRLHGVGGRVLGILVWAGGCCTGKSRVPDAVVMLGIGYSCGGYKIGKYPDSWRHYGY